MLCLVIGSFEERVEEMYSMWERVSLVIVVSGSGGGLRRHTSLYVLMFI